MAHSEVQATLEVISRKQTGTLTYQSERNLRRTSAWLFLLFLFMGELGTVWDREWHAYVGRDQFWTPPHIMMYSSVAGAGLLALAIVIIDTMRYHRRAPGVSDKSTVAIFHFFHAPMGYAVIGFGALCSLIAAPLDNYWHELYGVDVTLWAPFHVMGAIGGLISMIGMVYVFASEEAIQLANKEQARRVFGLHPLEIGLVAILASIMNYVITGCLQFPIITIGTLNISTYPLPIAAAGALCLLAALRTTWRPGITTILAVLICLHTTLVEAFVPWAIRVGAAQQNLSFRIPGQIPYFSIWYAIYPVIFLLPALLADLIAWRKAKKNRAIPFSFREQLGIGLLFGLSTYVLSPLLLSTYTTYAPIFLPEPGIPVSPSLLVTSIIVFGIAMIGAGLGGVLLGEEFGHVWRWNTR